MVSSRSIGPEPWTSTTAGNGPAPSGKVSVAGELVRCAPTVSATTTSARAPGAGHAGQATVAPIAASGGAGAGRSRPARRDRDRAAATGCTARARPAGSDAARSRPRTARRAARRARRRTRSSSRRRRDRRSRRASCPARGSRARGARGTASASFEVVGRARGGDQLRAARDERVARAIDAGERLHVRLDALEDLVGRRLRAGANEISGSRATSYLRRIARSWRITRSNAASMSCSRPFVRSTWVGSSTRRYSPPPSASVRAGTPVRHVVVERRCARRSRRSRRRDP